MQPSCHEDKKNVCEKICGCLIKSFLKINYDLTVNEYKKFNALRRECLDSFDENNKKHEILLEDFMNNCKDLDNNNNINNNINWKKIGFQVN
jgi:hypothetical protein